MMKSFGINGLSSRNKTRYIFYFMNETIECNTILAWIVPRQHDTNQKILMYKKNAGPRPAKYYLILWWECENHADH